VVIWVCAKAAHDSQSNMNRQRNPVVTRIGIFSFQKYCLIVVD
jgi:hypothetical protein